MLISVILPTYNEKENILPLIAELQKSLTNYQGNYEIVIVDDNSPDNTGKLVQEKYPTDPLIKVFIRENERGLASAIQSGILKSSGQLIVVMDTDFNHNPMLILQMVELLNYYDLIIGSRFVAGGGMQDKKRYWLSLFYNYALRIFLWLPTRDNLSGFFAIKRQYLFLLPFDKIFYGYGDYFIRLTYLARRLKFKILEIPVFYQIRATGESKSRFLDMFYRYTQAVLNLKFQKTERG